MSGNPRFHDNSIVWVARLLRKDDHDELTSIKVLASNKHEAMDKATQEMREFYPDYWHYAYVWVEEDHRRP